MFKLSQRYTLAPEKSWRLIDDFDSAEAAMESMKHPHVELIDDTLLKIVRKGKLVAFGLMRDNEGRMVDSIDAYIPGGASFNYGALYENNDSPSLLLDLCEKTKVDRKLLAAAALDLINLTTSSDEGKVLNAGLMALSEWAYKGAPVEKVRDEVQKLYSSVPRMSSIYSSYRFAAIMIPATGAAGKVGYGVASDLTYFATMDPRKAREKVLRIIRKKITLADVIRNVAVEIKVGETRKSPVGVFG